MSSLSRDELSVLAGRFPPGFSWGVATSAYQIEGGASIDGRGPSIWDVFSREPGRVENGDTGEVACDHYHRWRQDVGLMTELGISAYRFSISWSRILPLGTGTVNSAGLDFYDRLVDALLAAGIRPMINLYHWDLPQALQERGGWENPEIVEWFTDYAALVAGRLGDRVTEWMTLNEPQVFAFTGHATGKHAPGRRNWPLALRVAHAALGAHAAAVEVVRRQAPGARIGIALDVNHVVAATESEQDRAAAEQWRATRHGWFLDPIYGRGYPPLGVAAHEAAGHLADAELDEPPAGTPDFLGLNYYARETVAANPSDPFGAVVVPPAGSELTQMGWHVASDGLLEVLLELQRTYQPAEIVVSENGAAFPDVISADGVIADHERRSYVARHIEAVAEALEAGVPVRGYYVWSLLDNFEWSFGYSRRFGLVHVDFATQRRTIKESGRWYQAFLSSR